jgi:tetratricopeptide (TPR) repeat protein
MKKATYDKANQRRTIIMALGITVLEFLILVGIVSAGESSNALQSSNDWVHKGDELLCSAKFIEALAAYDKAIEINPRYSISLEAKKILSNGLNKSNL